MFIRPDKQGGKGRQVMTGREQKLLVAAQEILSDFNRYGEVLQTGDNGEYGTESSIGMLSAAIHNYNDYEYSCKVKHWK